MFEIAGHYLSTAHENVVEIGDNCAQLSGSDTISGFQQRIDIPLAAGIIVRRERGREREEVRKRQRNL